MPTKKTIQIALTLTLATLSQGVLADKISYYFSARNVSSQFGTKVPNENVTGSFTVNDQFQLTAIDLKLASHTYRRSEVGIEPSRSGPGFVIGGIVNRIQAIPPGIDDFFLVFDPATMLASTFTYSVLGMNDWYQAESVTLSISPPKNQIPEPPIGSLIPLAAVAAFAARSPFRW